ncbi:hypothetical protein [Streptomyces sp. NPDC008121]|uniref:hypothetical protein n=1 Tax=Streptomyces sp. NPDC008121 TaxID=3364809 RepID=UPI0036EC7D59
MTPDHEEERKQSDPSGDSMDEVASRLLREMGEAAVRLRRGAARFGQEPPPDDHDDNRAR